jgi:hypothetical protein
MGEERDESLFRREIGAGSPAEPAVDDPPGIERPNDQAVSGERGVDEGASGEPPPSQAVTGVGESRFQPSEPTAEVQESQPAAAEPAEPGSRGDELMACLGRIEQVCREMRGQLEALGRGQRYREFSPARLVGAILQSLVIGFVIAAVADWLYQASAGTQLVKIGLAGVLQLAALTAFMLGRGDR